MSASKDGLSAYRAKRDFRRSPEPSGRKKGGAGRGRGPRFVVQQHAARSMHFDFRIEVEGVLKSWAVPKGPSTDPREKRLAVATEDHPLDYADFEGVIPAGEYGAGRVIVWDRGTYENLTTDEDGQPVPIAAALRRGHADVGLKGEKLRGGWSLLHAKIGGERKNWLLVKIDDEQADARRNPTSTEPGSVLSGRTLDDLEEEDG